MRGQKHDRWAELLRRPEVHLAQLYESERFLAETVTTFLTAGLELGDTAVIIAERAHHEAFEREFAAAGVDVVDLVNRGQIVQRDADEILAAIMRGGAPDRARFEQVIGSLVGAASERPRIYGELVARLWRAGETSAAIALERLWGEFEAAYPRVSVLFGYPVESGGARPELERARPELEHVRGAHTEDLPLEDEVAPADEHAPIVERPRLSPEMYVGEVDLRSMLDESQDCTKVLDREGRLLFMNSGGMKALEICDFLPVHGANWLSFWTGEDRVAATTAFECAKAGGTGKFIGFFPLVQSKAPRWWHVVITPVRDRAGQITRLLAVSRDVTEQRQLEDELRRTLAESDQFVSLASHELRTPLTSLQLQLEMLDDCLTRGAPLPPDKISTLLARFRRQVGRLGLLVESMLGVSTIRSGRLVLSPERVELSTLVRTVCERSRELILLHRAELTLDLAPDLAGDWDPSRIEQVIENLLGNALKYAPGHPIQISTSRAGKVVRLAVRDRGPGIPSDQRDVIFDRYVRASTERSIGGLGLGLYIAKQLVEAHGGTIDVHSKPGDGAEFVIELPAAPTTEDRAA